MHTDTVLTFQTRSALQAALESKSELETTINGVSSLGQLLSRNNKTSWSGENLDEDQEAGNNEADVITTRVSIYDHTLEENLVDFILGLDLTDAEKAAALLSFFN